MIRRAVLGTSAGTSIFGQEEYRLIQVLNDRGIPFVEGTEKTVRRGKVQVTPDTLVIGGIPIVHAALRVLGLDIPPPDDYPPELHGFLHRRIWSGRLGDEANRGCFVKPKSLKKFTGRVMDWYDRTLFNGASPRTEVWVSDAVEWQKEWRCFVAHGELLGAMPYWGDGDVTLDLNVVQRAVQSLSSPPGGYCLDFGVLSTGETALIEMNHGYALGSYDLEPNLHYQVLEAWWLYATREKQNDGHV